MLKFIILIIKLILFLTHVFDYIIECFTRALSALMSVTIYKGKSQQKSPRDIFYCQAKIYNNTDWELQQSDEPL